LMAAGQVHRLPAATGNPSTLDQTISFPLTFMRDVGA
jgi:hypothetical protein